MAKKKQSTRSDSARETEDKVRSSLLFQSLFSPPKVNDGRLNKSKFVSHLSNEQGTNQFGSFDAAYRGNSRPRPERAWEIGEALRDEGGVPWASGLWFLWACGHLGDTIGVIATYVRMRRDVLSINECDAAWHMVAMSSTLARVTALDQTPPFASIHINKPSLDVQTIADLKTWYDAHCHTAQEAVHSALTHTLFLEREAAKFAFRNYGEMRATMSKAYSMWLRSGGKWSGESSLDELIRATMLVATSKQMPRKNCELATLVVYGQWLNSVESGVDSVLYPRPLKDEFRL